MSIMVGYTISSSSMLIIILKIVTFFKVLFIHSLVHPFTSHDFWRHLQKQSKDANISL